ncbi:MAG: RadC family protein [Plesiomonas sp.]|uniref:RadC family protein n=2 Tax=Plesiomonas sp. TaxID=2486279 RepID=UPI003EE59725
MSIKALPAAERPREKLLQQGAQRLSDAELLAIFLRTGIKGCNAIELAQRLLAEFGSLRALLAANQHEFCQHHGLGEAKYVQLQASVEMSRRYLAERLQRESALTSADATKAYLQTCLSAREREIFLVLFLDNQHRVIKQEEMFAGTFNSATVHPREIIKTALACNAAALILSHNHPSGVAEPSRADRSITQNIQQACGLVDIRVLDHIVVGIGETVSFAERGWI